VQEVVCEYHIKMEKMKELLYYRMGGEEKNEEDEL
jgi:hypothetical protein